MRNYGQHNALLCGIRAAQYAVIVTMDDDLQHPPEEIPKLLAVLDQGYDVVYGTPAHEAARLAARPGIAGDQAGLAERHGRADRPPGERLPRLSRRSGECVQSLRGIVRLDRRAADLGHEPVRGHAGASRAAQARALPATPSANWSRTP